MSNLRSCVHLTEDNQTTDWVSNSSTTLNVFPIYFPPFLDYNEWTVKSETNSVVHYRYCGPLIALMKTLAKRSSCNLALGPQQNELLEVFLEMASLINFDKIPDMLLFPFVPMNTVQNLKDSGLAEYRLSRFIGGMDGEAIFSRIVKAEWPALSYLDCFDDRIYIWLFISLLTMGSLVALTKRSIKELLATFFLHIRPKYLSDRILKSVWLFISIVLTAAYGGVMYERQTRTEPVITLNSLDEFTNPKGLWNNSKLYTFMAIGTFDHLFTKALTDHNSIENKLFQSSLDIDPLKMAFNPTILKEVFENILEKNYILSGNRLLIYNFVNIARLKFPELMAEYEEGVDYFISDTDVSKPYFLIVLSDIWTKTSFDLFGQLNYVITGLQENGIYEYEVRNALKYKGFGPEYDRKADVGGRSALSLSLNKLKGIAYLSSALLVASTTLFLFELGKYHFLIKFSDYIFCISEFAFKAKISDNNSETKIC